MFGRQLAQRARDRRLDVGRGLVDVAVEVELDDDRGRALDALRVIVWIDGIVENCLISGVATEFAIVSGEAPGSCAETVTTGKSTFGQRRDRQEPIGEEAGRRQRDREQDGRDRAADEGGGDVHRVPPAWRLRQPPPRRRRRDRLLDLRSVAEAELAFDDDMVAGFKPVLTIALSPRVLGDGHRLCSPPSCPA